MSASLPALGAAFAALLLATAPAAAAGPPVVAAAADLQFALADIATRFTADGGERVRLNFGSSGNFQRQIEQGAPYQLYFSADEAYVFKLADEGLTVGKGALYALGRVVLYAPQGSPLRPAQGLSGLGKALVEGKIERFAIANPSHAPYGRAAREALLHVGLWTALRPHLVLGENAAQAARFAASGQTQGGIIPLSLARAPALARTGRFALIPARWHRPLRQRMVLIQGAGRVARRFYRYLRAPEARAILARYGFRVPPSADVP